jgi:RNA polymerase sigma factor (sigma-70 family)
VARVTLSGPNALRHEPSGALDEGAIFDGRMAPPNTREGLTELYRELSTSLVRRLARQTGCGETARELAQEAFLRFLRLSSARAASVAHPEAYLRRISANLVRDWGRGRARQLGSDTPQFARDGHVDQVAVLETRDTLRRLEFAIAKLKPKTRKIFLAHRLDGLTYSEIAELTGLSVKGVEKQMSKAIAKIDQLLDRS